MEKSELGEEPQVSTSSPGRSSIPTLKVKPNPELVKFAVEMARKADEKTDRKNGAIADTLAKTYFDSGDAAKALETQERAIRLIKESGEPVDQAVKDRLETYKKAVEKE